MNKRDNEAVRYDEKLTLLTEAPVQSRKETRYRRVVATAIAACFLYVMVSVNFAIDRELQSPHQDVPSTKFLDYDDIIPSDKLEWHPCFQDNLKCARLTVPMDYHRPLNESKDHPKVHIALILYQGAHPGKKKYSVSPMLFNPGGPGGSGVQLVRNIAAGNAISPIIGEEQDVIGFDPRGIAATTPRADCYAFPLEGADKEHAALDPIEDYVTGNFHRTMWDLSFSELGIVNYTTSTLQKLDIKARTVAKLCQDKDDFYGKDSILKYVHTPSVARDMISIVDAWDEWTASLEKELGASREEVDEQNYEGKAVQDTKGQLVYWGFSYGTLLGATFASMFPDRVGRVVLDGVVDADLYVSPLWSESLEDTDTIYNKFAGYCHDGKELCPLYREGDRVEDIQARLDAALNSLESDPVSGINANSKAPVIVSISDVKLFLFSTLYSPTQMFPVVAFIVDLLDKGNKDAIAQILGAPRTYNREPFCAAPSPAWMYPTEAQAAIMCSDKRYPLDESLPELESRFQALANYSSFGDVWMTIMIGCEGWGIKAVDPPMRWDDHPAHKSKPIKTAFPVLFVSNTADPVTPLAAGLKMAQKFVDAGLLEQHSEGHCSSSAVSKCTALKLRDYFLHGKVPPAPKAGKDLRDGKWDRCDADEWPFHPYTEEQFIATNGVEATKAAEMLNGMKQMQDVLRKTDLWGKPKKFLDINLSHCAFKGI